MLINYESPLERNLYLDIDSDNAGAVAEGQDFGADTVDTSVDTEPAEPENFYSYKSDDGNETAFKDASEVNEFIRSGTLRHSDYTKKTQEVAENRKSLEADRARYDTEYTSFLGSKQQNDKIEEYLQSLPPEVYERLKQGINSQPKNQEFKDPRLDKLIEENESKAKQAEEESMRQAAFKSLSNTYDDFDQNTIMQAVKQLEEIAPGDQMRAFMEMLHFAGKGRISPAQMEQATTEALKRKQTVTTPMRSTNSTPSKQAGKYTSFDDAAEAAKNEL